MYRCIISADPSRPLLPSSVFDRTSHPRPFCRPIIIPFRKVIKFSRLHFLTNREPPMETSDICLCLSDCPLVFFCRTRDSYTIPVTPCASDTLRCLPSTTSNKKRRQEKSMQIPRAVRGTARS